MSSHYAVFQRRLSTESSRRGVECSQSFSLTSSGSTPISALSDDIADTVSYAESLKKRTHQSSEAFGSSDRNAGHRIADVAMEDEQCVASKSPSTSPMLPLMFLSLMSR